MASEGLEEGLARADLTDSELAAYARSRVSSHPDEPSVDLVRLLLHPAAGRETWMEAARQASRGSAGARVWQALACTPAIREVPEVEDLFEALAPTSAWYTHWDRLPEEERFASWRRAAANEGEGMALHYFRQRAGELETWLGRDPEGAWARMLGSENGETLLLLALSAQGERFREAFARLSDIAIGAAYRLVEIERPPQLTSLQPADLKPLLESREAPIRLAAIQALSRLRGVEASSKPELGRGR